MTNYGNVLDVLCQLYAPTTILTSQQQGFSQNSIQDGVGLGDGTTVGILDRAVSKLYGSSVNQLIGVCM